MNRLKAEWIRIRSSSLSRNAGWMLLGQGFSTIFQGAYFIVLGRLLGSTEYGIYVGTFAMVSMLSQYSSFGSHSVFLRYVSQKSTKFSLYWGNVIVTTCTLGSVFVAILAYAVPAIARSYSWKLVFWVAIGDCLCSQLTLAAGRVFQAFEKMYITSALNLLTNMLRMLSAVFMLCFLRHAIAFQWAVIASIISAIAAFAAIALVTKQYGTPKFSTRLLKKRAGEGFIFALSYSTTGVYNDIDKAILGHYGMNASNGIYSMAYRVIDVACTPFGAVQSAAFPRFFKKGTKGICATGEFAFNIVKRTVPLTLLTTTIMLVTAPIIPCIVGKDFTESVSALRWLCLLPVFRSVHSALGDALTGAGFQRLRLGTQAIAAVLNFNMNLYFIPHFGWRGAAWSSLATDGMLSLLNWAILIAVMRKQR